MRILLAVKIISLLLVISKFRYLTSSEQFKLLKSNGFFIPEVPLDKVFEFSFLEFKAGPLDQILELLDLNGLSLFMFNSEE